MGVPAALMQTLLTVSSPSTAGIGIIPASPRSCSAAAQLPDTPLPRWVFSERKESRGSASLLLNRGKIRIWRIPPCFGILAVLFCSSPDLSRLAQRRPRCSNWDFLGCLVVLREMHL